MNKIKEALLESKKMNNINTDVLEKEIADMEVKANEVMNTGATAFGTELIPQNVVQESLEMIPTYSNLLAELPGNQGTNLPQSAKFPIIGEADIFQGNSEWTTGTGITTPADNGPATSDITITQGQFYTTVSLSKWELNYSSDKQLEAKVKDRINKSAARTVEALILNADSATSGNVNLDGGTPSGTYYLENNNGLRDIVIADSNTYDVAWTLSEADFIGMKGKLGEGYAADLDNLLRVMPQNIYDKCLLIDSLITRDKSEFDTFNTGKFGRIFGIKVVVARDMPATAQASGKVSSTGGSNTLGQFALVYKPAVQYGFGMPLEIAVDNVPGKGVNLIATFDFGMAIAYDKSGLGKTAVLGVNVTL